MTDVFAIALDRHAKLRQELQELEMFMAMYHRLSRLERREGCRAPEAKPQGLPPSPAGETAASDYQGILDCYVSGQMSPAAFREHLQDEGFRAWLAEHGVDTGRESREGTPPAVAEARPQVSPATPAVQTATTDPMQGGAVAARLAHNQEVAGASPAPATNSRAHHEPDRAGQGSGSDALPATVGDAVAPEPHGLETGSDGGDHVTAPSTAHSVKGPGPEENGTEPGPTLPNINNSLGIKGVYFDQTDGRYRAQIRVKGEKHNLGSFDTAEEASAAYERARLELREPAAEPATAEPPSAPQTVPDATVTLSERQEQLLAYLKTVADGSGFVNETINALAKATGISYGGTQSALNGLVKKRAIKHVSGNIVQVPRELAEPDAAPEPEPAPTIPIAFDSAAPRPAWKGEERRDMPVVEAPDRADRPARLAMSGFYLICGDHHVRLPKLLAYMMDTLVAQWGDDVKRGRLVEDLMVRGKMGLKEARTLTEYKHLAILNDHLKPAGLVVMESADHWRLQKRQEAGSAAA